MRLTWLVLGIVVAAGAVAFINTGDDPVALPEAASSPDDPTARRPALNRPSGSPAPPSPAQAKSEQHARAILEGMARARAEGNAAKEAALAERLRKEAWSAPSARRWAAVRGQRLLVQAGESRSREAIQKKDRARRLLSRVLYLPEMFKASGASTDERTAIIRTIQKVNRQVMRHGTGIEGVTSKFVVPGGITPVQIVSRKKLPMGSNALLYWNQGRNLDPTRLREGQTILLPTEALSLHVHLGLRRMGIFIGDWFVKEFRVGIGKADTPTPLGTFKVHSRARNPDWHPAGRKPIPYGDPRNELGSAWIAIVNESS